MGIISSEVINQVLERCDIVETISTYIPLKRTGRNFKALCPFHHEKTPSFVVNAEKQIFHCFGCGVGGNAISFVMQQERLGFPEAIRLLAEKHGIRIAQTPGQEQARSLNDRFYQIHRLALEHFHQNLLTDKSPGAQAARAYLKARQLTLEAVKQFQIGFALDEWESLLGFLRKHDVPLNLMEKAGLIVPKAKGEGFYDRFRNRIIFPILDARGRCVAFGARTMEKDNSAKYINSPETGIYTKGRHLYGLHLAKEAIGRQDAAVIVEGYMDFITPFMSGVTNIVASLGTALTVEQIRQLRRYTNHVVMLFDSDQAGEAATVRSLDVLIEEGMTVKVASLEAKHDPDSFIRSFGVEPFQERIEKAQSLFDFKLKSLLGKNPDKGVENRARIATEMLATIQKFDNAIVRTEYVKRLAHDLAVSEEALCTELRRMQGGSSGPALSAVKKMEASQSEAEPFLRPVERDLLKLMLEENDFVPLTKGKVEIEDFQNGHVRHIVEKIFDLFERGERLSLSALMNCFDDEKTHRLLSQLVCDNILLGDKSRIHRDCIARLKQERDRSRRQEILRQMELARNGGNEERLKELTYEFNQLIKG